jgi:hypothetical protein
VSKETKNVKKPKQTGGKGKTAKLTARDLKQVAGGTTFKQDITVNKAKTANKAFEAMDAYIRS